VKKKTCAQLGGACDMRFLGNTFHEIAQLWKLMEMKYLKLVIKITLR